MNLKLIRTARCAPDAGEYELKTGSANKVLSLNDTPTKGDVRILKAVVGQGWSLRYKVPTGRENNA